MEKLFIKKIDNNHNNYIYLFEENLKSDLYYSKLSKKLSSSIEGLSSDGIIILNKLSEKKFRMSIFNSDGTKAKMCGNGLKGSVVFLESLGLLNLKENDVFYIKSDSGMRKIIKLNENYLVNIGKPVLYEKFFNININFDIYSFYLYGIDIGNKHFIYFFKENYFNKLEEFYLFDIEKLFIFTHENYFIEEWSKKKEVVNVSVVIFWGDKIFVRTYERGAKETFACGTASASISSIFFNYYEKLMENINFSNNDNFNLIFNKDSTFIDLYHKGGIIRNYNYKNWIYQKVNSYILFEGYYFYEE